MKPRLSLVAFLTLNIGLPVFSQGLLEFKNYDPVAGIDTPVFWLPNLRIDGADPLFRAALLAGPAKGAVPAGPGVGNLTMLASPVTGDLGRVWHRT